MGWGYLVLAFGIAVVGYRGVAVALGVCVGGGGGAPAPKVRRMRGWKCIAADGGVRLDREVEGYV